MRVVIDTNVLVSSFQNPDGHPKKIIDMWKNGDFILCISEAILFEYIDILGRLDIPKQKIKEMAELFKMMAYVEMVSDTILIDIIKDDPHDNKFIECAVAANAQYIISGDKHLKTLKEYGSIKILSPGEFLNL